jgi:mono/diheme cytochrome c family protein
MGGTDIGGFEGAGFVPSSNITQDKETGIGNWTDGEIFRAVTAGVDKNGKPLAPMMPYIGYGQMDEEDVKSIIAYIKTLKPIKNKIADKSLVFPLSIMVKIIPGDPKFGKLPDTTDRVKTGQYYSGACFTCHTQFEKGKPNMEKYFAGGKEFPLPDGKIVRSANITPDKETGIGSWTKQQFLDRFKLYVNHENLDIQKIGYMTVMPWNEFATGYKESDLAAVYDYIMTIKPVSNKVEKISIQGIK